MAGARAAAGAATVAAYGARPKSAPLICFRSVRFIAFRKKGLPFTRCCKNRLLIADADLNDYLQRMRRARRRDAPLA